MKFLNWTKAAILYEDDFGLVRLQDLVRTPYTKNLELYIRQTTPDNYRMVLGEIKKKGISNIIVDTSSNNINYFFRYYIFKGHKSSWKMEENSQKSYIKVSRQQFVFLG